ncbi:MAG: hypothetical protein QXF35_01590 [Candidatus Bilamarchaeaceae archaeon]
MSDEMECPRLGKQNWFVDVMDTETRFMVASDYMESRTIEDLIRIRGKAKLTTNGNVKIITTDGLQGYLRVLRKIFGLNRIEGEKAK